VFRLVINLRVLAVDSPATALVQQREESLSLTAVLEVPASTREVSVAAVPVVMAAVLAVPAVAEAVIRAAVARAEEFPLAPEAAVVLTASQLRKLTQLRPHQVTDRF
jgi:hypothetical protein